jgi:predicted nicotinamide N-methyase
MVDGISSEITAHRLESIPRQKWEEPTTSSFPLNLKIAHKLTSLLDETNSQIWSGAYLLTEYILAHPRLLKSKGVLELGAGTGLCGLTAAKMGAERVFLTDKDTCYLTLNAKENQLDNVVVKRVDWSDETCPLWSSSVSDWSKQDVKYWKEEITLILAADVIYNHPSTLFFAQRLKTMLLPAGRRPRTLILSVEKRINLANGKIGAQAWDEFIDEVKSANSQLALGKEALQIKLEQISIDDIPRVLDYDRNDYQLELWRITMSKVSKSGQ